MKTAYLDCFSGISGDMFLGALLDAGLPFRELRDALLTLPFKGYRMEAKREARCHIQGTRFLVRLDHTTRVHRNLRDVKEVIREGDLTEGVKEKSIRVFEMLAEVEGEIHGLPPDRVHFHEVGAVDSIIDVVGTVYGLDRLGIGSLFVSPLPLGSGFVKTAHGRIPVPAPATLALLKEAPVFEAGVAAEMVTPTGAALVRCLSSSFGPMPPMVVGRVGYGVGTRDLADRPNLLRIVVGDEDPQKGVDTVVVIETSVDDATPECLGYLMDRLLEAGALDVVFFPVHMKKNRPGVQIQVLGMPHQKDLLIDIVARESGTLGVRFRYSLRRVMERSFREVDSPWGRIMVKEVRHGDGSSFLAPEYEVCRAVASKHHIPLREVCHYVTGLNPKPPEPP